MSEPPRTAKSLGVAALMHPASRALARCVARLTRGSALTFVISTDDPYSLLVSQVLPRIRDKYDVEIRTLVLREPRDDVDPDRERRHRWALQDAKRLADSFGLRFPDDAQIPETATTSQLLMALRLAPDCESITEVLYEGLQNRCDTSATKSPDDHGRVRRLGHYTGGMIHYAGAWYWGLDRLNHLEARLANEPVQRWAPVLGEPTVDARAPDKLEVFFSFRSPYSYLALARLARASTDAAIELRPVLPMVMRGLQVPRIKRLYLAFDAKREADRLGIPYGRIADPLGEGVERCIAALTALPEVLRLPFAALITRWIWSEGVNVSNPRAIESALAEVGADAELAKRAVQAFENAPWREVAKENRRVLLEELDLWGVPSFRAGDCAIWGHDRMEWLGFDG